MPPNRRDDYVSFKETMTHISRRTLFGAGVSAPLWAASARASKVIFLVADGMSAGVLPLAERFSLSVRRRSTNWAELMRRRDVAHGWLDMSSLDSAVTDSAAASSSWGSGSRVMNASINTLPDGRALMPVMRLVKDRGVATGLVTTATVTHATPAGFAAAIANRDDEAAIAVQYLQCVDIVLGGGAKFFEGKLRKDGRDLTAEFAGRGYTVLRNADELATARSAPRTLGLFSPSHVPYRIDRGGAVPAPGTAPTLDRMTRYALRALTDAPRGFLLQVEGARVDHAAHANDAAALLWEQLEFDDALGVCLDYQRAHPETLIVVTSDHGNSNPGLTGMGPEYEQSNACFSRLADFRVSHHELAHRLGGSSEYSGIRRTDAQPVNRITPEDAREILHAGTNLSLTDAELGAVCAVLQAGPLVVPANQLNNINGVLGMVFGNHIGIGWTGTTHTSDWTVVAALGPEAASFNGLLLNTDVFGVVTRRFGVVHVNPTGTPMARTHAPGPMRPHWV